MATDLSLSITASLLRRGAALDRFSTALTLISLVVALMSLLPERPDLPLITLLAAVVALGFMEKYYALRVAFDAELFQALAEDSASLPTRTQALDQALVELKLQPVDKAGRSWLLRSQGALKLLRKQGVSLALQALLLLGIVLVHPCLSLFS